MDRDRIREYKRRREAVDLFERQERAARSGEEKLKQTAALFAMALRLGWGRSESDPEVAAVRRRWMAIKSKDHAR